MLLNININMITILSTCIFLFIDTTLSAMEVIFYAVGDDAMACIEATIIDDDDFEGLETITGTIDAVSPDVVDITGSSVAIDIRDPSGKNLFNVVKV